MTEPALMDPPSAAKEVHRMIPTRSAVEDETASFAQRDWIRRLEVLIRRWTADPAGLALDDLIPPTPAACRRAREIAQEMHRQPSPTRIVLDTDGGLSFELESDDHYQSIDVLPDGSAELLTFDRGQLISRVSIPTGE